MEAFGVLAMLICAAVGMAVGNGDNEQAHEDGGQAHEGSSAGPVGKAPLTREQVMRESGQALPEPASRKVGELPITEFAHDQEHQDALLREIRLEAFRQRVKQAELEERPPE